MESEPLLHQFTQISDIKISDIRYQTDDRGCLKVSPQFKSQYLDRLKIYLPTEILQNPDFESSVLASLDELAELGSLDVCEARKKGLSLSCEPQDLAERVLSLADGNEFIAGARFKNLDIDFPFVEIHSGIEMSSEALIEISEIVQKEFRNIHPKGLKFKDKPNIHSDLEIWSHVVFGKIEKRKEIQTPSELKLSFTQDLQWHDQYVSEYQERLSDKTELEGFVRIGQLDEFQESATDQALMIASDANGLCGVFAGIKSPLYGLSAIYMIESYLSKRWIGKKTAPVAHAFFLNEMSKRFNFVWGTIYAQNFSSLKTALRVGRRVIETEYFFNFDR